VPPPNPLFMDRTDVASRVNADTDDVLATIPLVAGNEKLTGHLFDQLVDLLLEGVLVGLRSDLADGRLTAQEFADELATLATQCRRVGLLETSL
jgi:hypothetical protein